MFNYENLSDYEFEILCCDIVSKKLGIQLRTFATGKDGGIDATDDTKKHNIVVQAKHYLKSSYATLYRTLCGEVEKVKRLKSKLCCRNTLDIKFIILRIRVTYILQSSNWKHLYEC